MTACATRPTYGLPELLALVSSILRPWLDAIRTEFGPAAPTPTPVLQPQPTEPVGVPEPVAELPAVAPVADEPIIVERPVAEPVAEVPALYVWPESPALAADEPLYVKRGDGRGARYVVARPDDTGPKFRRKLIGATRVSYVSA